MNLSSSTLVPVPIDDNICTILIIYTYVPCVLIPIQKPKNEMHVTLQHA